MEGGVWRGGRGGRGWGQGRKVNIDHPARHLTRISPTKLTLPPRPHPPATPHLNLCANTPWNSESV